MKRKVKVPENTMFFTISIIRLLHKYGCTYNRSEEILQSCLEEIRDIREQEEEELFHVGEDFGTRKVRDVGNERIFNQHHVRGLG